VRHNPNPACQVDLQTSRVKAKHCLVVPLTQELGDLQTEVMSVHLSSRIDCTALEQARTVLVQVAAMEVVGAVDSVPYRLM